MSQVIATIDLIRRSMYLINAVAAGEIPDDADLNDGLLTLNEMLDSWNIQPLAAYASPNENWTLTPAQAVYDWGPTAVGGFTSDRPVTINNVTCVRNGVTTPVRVITQAEYDAITIKSTSQPLVERVLYINSYPLGRLTCFPVPSEAVVLNFSINNQIPRPVTLQSMLTFPPGYLRAIRYNLAVEMWPEYTNVTTDIGSIKAIAKEALGKIKVANSDPVPSTFEDVPGTYNGRDYDWRGG